FHRYFPGAPLLIDTYDTVAAAERLAEQVNAGMPLAGVRIDSGDLAEAAKAVRSHLPNTPIFASGDLDEFAIARLREQSADIDGYGLGTKLVTGAPVNGVYKLVDIDGTPVMKESSGKLTYPGRKQIFRRYEKENDTDSEKAVSDRLALTIEGTLPGEVPLLQRVMHSGNRLFAPEDLDAIAHRTAASVAALPDSVRRLSDPDSLPVETSHGLKQLTEHARHGH
ncbi:MAG: nicotinate phosphoribosyltransferase, partial [Phormidesmis sp.]